MSSTPKKKSVLPPIPNSPSPTFNYQGGVPAALPPGRFGRVRVPSKDNILQFSVPDSPGYSRSGQITPAPLPDDFLVRHQVDETSLEPWRYLLGLPGKNVRDQLIDAFSIWIPSSPANLTMVKQIIGYLHTASLMIDDIEDGSDTRRGFPATHIVHGTASTINAGNYVYFLALEKVLALPAAFTSSAVKIYATEILNLHRGQGRDIWFREKQKCPTEMAYLDMVKDKTGGLFRMAIRLLDCLQKSLRFGTDDTGADSSEDEEINNLKGNVDDRLALIIALVDDLAVFFQIRDDYINLASAKFQTQKGFAEDLTEGKYSFLVVKAVSSLKAEDEKAARELLDILNLHTTDRSVKNRAIELLKLGEAFTYTREYLGKLKQGIVSQLTKLGDNPNLQKILDALCKDLDDCSL